MNPITITGPKGTYTVEAAAGAYLHWGRYIVRDAFGTRQWAAIRGKRGDVLHACLFHHLPFALRLAAELAGIERQRVVVEGDSLFAHDHRWGEYSAATLTRNFWWDRDEQNHLGEQAHGIAAALYQPWKVEHLRDEARASMYAYGVSFTDVDKALDALTPFFEAIAERALTSGGAA